MTRAYIGAVEEGSVTSPRGFRAGIAHAGIKPSSVKPDIALIASTEPCNAAGVFTTNQICAAPVQVSRATLQDGANQIHGVVINSGNANACTGEEGLLAAYEMQEAAAVALGCTPTQVLLMSTGVIGVPLPVAKVQKGVASAAQILSERGGLGAAEAIMTTDTRAKYTAVTLNTPEGLCTIGGIAKGSGMIHPNMATMLAILTTDASIDAQLLQTVLQTAVNGSFNRISVDGDTSTNDSVFLLANGLSGLMIDDSLLLSFTVAVTDVCRQLAQMIVRDGEGATKFVEITVSGTETEQQAHQIANAIATSPLVKTAVAGGDANWGRILAAAGRAGIPFDQHQAALWISKPDLARLQLVAAGTPLPYAEADAAEIFQGTEIFVQLQVGQGQGQATVWTCDLTQKYVSINADYRT